MKSIGDGCNPSNAASIPWTVNEGTIIYETRANVKGISKGAPNHATS